jgi:hypothetical protein
MKACNFTVDDLEEIASVLGGKLHINITFNEE